uniref:Uncharacterized protein n=1 Tax=Ananas comosus var. bracteatus TaxID=296719 RepID=A0A6V7P9F5_ANACO|nr:unnamed protein product [Ananas comosus var. bracteatus]
MDGVYPNWSDIEGAWVLKPKTARPTCVVHFIGGIFVGAAPQLTYRFFLERLSEKGALVIATPFASGFDHFLIADEVQFKFDRCLRYLQEIVTGLPTFGVGHSLGSVIHLLIGSRYAIQRSGNVLMAFNNKEASVAVPLFSPVIVPMAQSFGPVLSQLTSSPTFRMGVYSQGEDIPSNPGPQVAQWTYGRENQHTRVPILMAYRARRTNIPVESLPGEENQHLPKNAYRLKAKHQTGLSGCTSQLRLPAVHERDGEGLGRLQQVGEVQRDDLATSKRSRCCALAAATIPQGWTRANANHGKVGPRFEGVALGMKQKPRGILHSNSQSEREKKGRRWFELKIARGGGEGAGSPSNAAPRGGWLAAGKGGLRMAWVL